MKNYIFRYSVGQTILTNKSNKEMLIKADSRFKAIQKGISNIEGKENIVSIELDIREIDSAE